MIRLGVEEVCLAAHMSEFKKMWLLELKVKRSHYRPGQVLRVPGGWGSQISRQSAHEGGKVVSHTQRLTLPARKYSWYSFLLGAESTSGDKMRPEGLCQWKIPMTPSGIEPSTFRLVAQCLNQLRQCVPISSWDEVKVWGVKGVLRRDVLSLVWFFSVQFKI